MTFKPSRHNIISPFSGDGKYIVVNILTGNADIIDSTEKQQIEAGISDGPQGAEFIRKGYLCNPDEEVLSYKLRYIEFLQERDDEELQIFFVPSFNCNFSCSYCYQSNYPVFKNPPSTAVIDGFFEFIQRKFENRKKYITLFGGEPLMTGKSYKDAIFYFLNKSRSEGIDIAIVTNGYFIDENLDVLESDYIREIQITLDGSEDVHNARRRLKSSGPTFQKIVDNTDLCLAKGIPVNLRMVIDRDNIDEIAKLANFAIKKGWTDHSGFKTQIGRNYELHYCQNGKSKLYDRLSLYQALYEQITKHPEILRFHKPAFSVIKFLEENGKLPNPVFDACPACKSEWAFDFTGSIYSCTATVGKPGEKLGTFHPDVCLDHGKIDTWRSRDVLHIEKCRDCNLQLVCGGGCGLIAANASGSILSPDCRPITEIHSLGAVAYLNTFLDPGQ